MLLLLYLAIGKYENWFNICTISHISRLLRFYYMLHAYFIGGRRIDTEVKLGDIWTENI